jgi:hypothetical protein
MSRKSRLQSAFRLSVCVAILLISFALSDDCPCQVTATWLGNSTAWENSSNWDLGYIPGSQNDVYIPAELSFYPNLTYAWVFMKSMQAEPGASLSMYAGGNCQVNIYGNLNFGGNFTPGGGRINFRGSTACVISSFNFGDVNFAKYTITPFGPLTSTVGLAGDISIAGDCWIDTCNLETGEYAVTGGEASTMTIRDGVLRVGSRDFPSGFSSVDAISGLVEYNGTDDQGVCADFEYGDLHIIGSGHKLLCGDVVVQRNLDMGVNDIVYFMGHDLSVSGNVTIEGRVELNQGGGLLLNGSTVTLRDSAEFSAVGGSWAQGPRVSRPQNSSSYYSFTAGVGAAILEAKFATFEYMDSLGIYVASAGITVSPENCFDHCRFQHGQNIVGAALLTINNSQDLEIRNADFPVMGNVNVRKTVSSGHVLFINASGVFAGEDYEYDPYNRIDWVAYPDIVLPDTSHDFGQVLLGESDTWLMQVVNDGQEVLDIEGITPSPYPPFFCDPTSQQTLQPLDTLTVEVVFEPEAEGEYQGNIMMVCNDPYQDTVLVPLTGTCVANSVPILTEPIPSKFALKQNYPNPFNASTTIRFDLNRTDHVSVRIYDVLGRVVATLVDSRLNAGTHEIHFNAADLPSGIYFYRCVTSSNSECIKMVLLK